MRPYFFPALRGALFATAVATLIAEPLSKKFEIDFFRDTPSRNLKGLAVRSDGRLLAGPSLTDLAGAAPADLLWCLAPDTSPGQWLIGTGPDGKIFGLTPDFSKGTSATREICRLPEPHIFALLALSNGSILAGTSPKGALCLVRDGKLVARLALPADSVLDLLALRDGSVLAATGNPGHIYRIDPAKFAASGIIAQKLTEAKALAAHGITLFGVIRDRNVRSLALLSDDRVIAGSAPRGNIYAFDKNGGDPVILQENREAEVTSLLAGSAGDFFVALTFSGTTMEARVTPPEKPAKNTPESPPAASPPLPEKFTGRASVVQFPAAGFPETLTSRNNTAFYGLARRGDVLLMAGGEQGELLGYDLRERLAITFAGSASAQLGRLVPVPGTPDRYLTLRNNAPGVAMLDFGPLAHRSAETRRLDLGVPARLGALHLDHLRDATPAQLSISLRTSNGTDEVEGWSAWTAARHEDDSWRTEGMRGRFVKLRVTVSADTPATLQIGKGDLFHLPQNRRPQVQDYRVLSPNFAVLPAADSPPSPVTSLSQLMQAAPKDDDKRKGGFSSSQVVPSPGSQVILWTVSDPDGDNVDCTFSLRRAGEAAWTDLAVATRDPFVQFDTSHLPDGIYSTRLVATEAAPRPLAERLSTTLENDDLIVDHTPPIILEATAARAGDRLVVSVHGRDALSLLEGIEITLNNGATAELEQPADGIRDGRDETFALELPLGRVTGATSLEVTLYDAAGNSSSRRLSW